MEVFALPLAFTIACVQPPWGLKKTWIPRDVDVEADELLAACVAVGLGDEKTTNDPALLSRSANARTNIERRCMMFEISARQSRGLTKNLTVSGGHNGFANQLMTPRTPTTPAGSGFARKPTNLTAGALN